ncbi:TetR/AcrR family transcriptional regulator [Actinomadura rupiterrae]|uniref:TetR/AcrR family transcriptional regulator n=1 Tax=Actinomadura rupiterrae TaxID=559627 RepID=UPI0020A5443A|nr:TetR/AcrR family transcriptional regulator [Actinomadura rupiterrae]MCP2334981.1 AcrR family transcriptional regulator [Actinomadura rupiterrae]
MTGTASAHAGTAARGRIDKRQAILDAAFAVFAREGYAQAGVDVIAAEAGVAKATVYNHFGDKETLLRAAFLARTERAVAANLDALEALADTGGDLRELLEGVAVRLLDCYCDGDSWALRRLLLAEQHQFPDLLDISQTNGADRVMRTLADRLARLALAGRLAMTDPELAAEQFSALLTAPIAKRTRQGTRALTPDEVRTAAREAVDTFLRAFTPASA